MADIYVIISGCIISIFIGVIFGIWLNKRDGKKEKINLVEEYKKQKEIINTMKEKKLVEDVENINDKEVTNGEQTTKTDTPKRRGRIAKVK